MEKIYFKGLLKLQVVFLLLGITGLISFGFIVMILPGILWVMLNGLPYMIGFIFGLMGKNPVKSE